MSTTPLFPTGSKPVETQNNFYPKPSKLEPFEIDSSSAAKTGDKTILEQIFPCEEDVSKELCKSGESARNMLGIRASRALTVIASISLGVMSGLAILGVMTTPAGWAIAGAALCIGLLGALYCGGVDELLKAIGSSVVSFGFSVVGVLCVGVFAAGGVLI